MESNWLAIVVTLFAWMTPLPQHAQGKLVYYGPQYLSEANAEFRGYDLAPYWQRCGVAVMSPADLGRTVWLRVDGGEWIGPCLAVDVAARIHFARAVWYVREIVEVPQSVRDLLGFENGVPGYTWIGACPPAVSDLPPAEAYDPPLDVDTLTPDARYSMFPYPPQELPAECR